MKIEITNFAKRQYKKDYKGTKVSEEIVKKLIQLAQSANCYEGYAPFCKIISIRNQQDDGSFLFDFKYLVTNKEEALTNNAILHTAYEARTPEELPILTEWVSNISVSIAPFIHIIVYSREQLEKENDIIQANWGIVNIITAGQFTEEPMKPMTIMRNALGIEEGGSGVALNAKAYHKSVQFWSKNIMIRETS